MPKIAIKSASISQGNSTCDHCGTRIRNLVTVTELDGTLHTVGTTCFRKIFGFTPKGDYPPTIAIVNLCGGCPVKTVENGLHKRQNYLATVGRTEAEILTLKGLWESGQREVDRLEWNAPYWWQVSDENAEDVTDPYMADALRWHGGDMLNT